VEHPGYVRKTNLYDIALLQVSTPMQFNKRVKPVCVDYSVFPPGNICYVTGWGETEVKKDFLYKTII